MRIQISLLIGPGRFRSGCNPMRIGNILNRDQINISDIIQQERYPRDYPSINKLDEIYERNTFAYAFYGPTTTPEELQRAVSAYNNMPNDDKHTVLMHAMYNVGIATHTPQYLTLTIMDVAVIKKAMVFSPRPEAFGADFCRPDNFNTRIPVLENLQRDSRMPGKLQDSMEELRRTILRPVR